MLRRTAIFGTKTKPQTSSHRLQLCRQHDKKPNDAATATYRVLVVLKTGRYTKRAIKAKQMLLFCYFSQKQVPRNKWYLFVSHAVRRETPVFFYSCSCETTLSGKKETVVSMIELVSLLLTTTTKSYCGKKSSILFRHFYIIHRCFWIN